jgi:hypothetical protein
MQLECDLMKQCLPEYKVPSAIATTIQLLQLEVSGEQNLTISDHDLVPDPDPDPDPSQATLESAWTNLPKNDAGRPAADRPPALRQLPRDREVKAGNILAEFDTLQDVVLPNLGSGWRTRRAVTKQVPVTALVLPDMTKLFYPNFLTVLFQDCKPCRHGGQ